MAAPGAEACWEGLYFQILKDPMHMHQTRSEQLFPPAHPYCSVPSSFEMRLEASQNNRGEGEFKERGRCIGAAVHGYKGDEIAAYVLHHIG